jgi:hypothetical protein
MKEEALLQVIQFFYPTARYVAVAPVAAGRLEGEEDQQSYVYASLYDHKVGSQMRPIGDHLVVINNTYISSFAYNVALCHLVGSARRLSPGDLARLYRHNFKKFFAEQVAYLQNVLVGRAWLIETILYEQDLMKDAFAGVLNHALEEQAGQIASLASGIISYHELTHYFEARSPAFDAQYRAEVVNTFEDLDEEVLRLGGVELRTEFRCDLAATRLSLDLPSAFARADLFRVLLFVFYVLADLAALTESAKETAAAAAAEEGYIDLLSAEPPQHAFGFKITRDRGFDVRVDAQERALARLAEQEGIALFDENASFPLTPSTRALLRAAQDSIGDIEEAPVQGLSGTDRLRRGLAQILAESLKGCDAGVEFLLWRSKKFNLAGKLRFE